MMVNEMMMARKRRQHSLILHFPPCFLPSFHSIQDGNQTEKGQQAMKETTWHSSTDISPRLCESSVMRNRKKGKGSNTVWFPLYFPSLISKGDEKSEQRVVNRKRGKREWKSGLTESPFFSLILSKNGLLLSITPFASRVASSSSWQGERGKDSCSPFPEMNKEESPRETRPSIKTYRTSSHEHEEVEEQD